MRSPIRALDHLERGHLCPAHARTRANEDARIRSELDACNAGHSYPDCFVGSWSD